MNDSINPSMSMYATTEDYSNAMHMSAFVSFLASNLAYAEFEEQVKNKYGSGRSVYVVIRGEKPENYISRSIQNFLVTEDSTKILDAFWLGLHGKWREVLSNV